MQQKQVAYITRGMTRDLADSKASTEFAFENMNLRLTPTDDNTLLTLVNEKGNTEITFTHPVGKFNGMTSRTVLGYAIINHKIVLFMIGEFGVDQTFDCISYIKYNASTQQFIETPLFKGHLNFSDAYPIETYSLYEAENIQKVYWVDGLNSPRVIKIDADSIITEAGVDNPNQFDFLVTLKGTETVSVAREPDVAGLFPGGTLQYCLTYSKTNGQESKIFWTSELLYTTFQDRAISPEETGDSSYRITIEGADTLFDNINVYSIIRTSENSTPIVKLVTQVPIDKSGNTAQYNILDTNTTGEIVDSTLLLFIGGDDFVAGTLTAKDNVLFLGNLKVKGNSLPEGAKSIIARYREADINTSNTTIPDWIQSSGYVAYNNPLLHTQTTYLRAGNKYRLGLQLLSKKGVWSEPVFLKDYEATERPSLIPENDTPSGLSIPKISMDISAADSSTIKQAGYIKVRPLIVYPEPWERAIIAQGIVCPTVFNGIDRASNIPYAQSSWFFRPYFVNDATTSSHSLENRHAHILPLNDKYNSEIQYMGTTEDTLPVEFSDYATVAQGDAPNHRKKFSETNNFFVDANIITFHSPDINDNTLESYISTNNGLRIVGAFSIDSGAGRYNINSNNQTAATTDRYSRDIVSSNIGNLSNPIGDITTRGLFTTRTLAHYTRRSDIIAPSILYSLVYPWHNNDSLFYYEPYNSSSVDVFSTSADLSYRYKIISNIRASQRFNFYSSDNYAALNLKSARIFNRINGEAYLTLPTPDNSYFNVSNIFYAGSFNKLMVVDAEHEYPVRFTDSFDGTLNNVSKSINDSVWIQYSSTTHAVLQLDENKVLPVPFISNRAATNKIPFWLDDSVSPESDITKNLQSSIHLLKIGIDDLEELKQSMQRVSLEVTEYALIVDPDRQPTQFTFKILTKAPGSTLVNVAPWDISILNTVSKLIINSDSNHIGSKAKADPSITRLIGKLISVSKESTDTYKYMGEEVIALPRLNYVDYTREIMWITELTRDISGLDNIFGGNTEYAYKNNKWLPCGTEVTLDSTNGTTIEWTEGDTIFSRWDCLKTLPFNNVTTNQIVEIMSFMCESYVNTAGRYDKYRNLQDYTFLESSDNFNVINPAYNNKNNYFSYRILDTDINRNFNFPTQITWSLTKTLGEAIDTWTNISLASILDLDGNKGDVNALRMFRNQLLCFQDTGISEIIYNPSAAIATTTGVPIEIANSGKVEGKRYLSEDIGCINKWSICITSAGVYFADSIQKKLYLLSSGIQCISDSKGFNEWARNTIKDTKVWKPSTWDSIVTQYDRTTGDVYFITKDTCLAFNELLGNFTSFYSYEKTSFMINLDDQNVAVHAEANVSNNTLWRQHSGAYSHIYGSSKPYYTEIIVNENPTMDKIFTNLDFRADSWRVNASNSWVLQEDTFDKISIWNEYQSGTQTLTFTPDIPSSLKKKFRIWRTQLPRNNNSRDRIRNPWVHIRLSKTAPTAEKTQLHDMVVTYYI